MKQFPAIKSRVFEHWNDLNAQGELMDSVKRKMERLWLQLMILPVSTKAESNNLQPMKINSVNLMKIRVNIETLGPVINKIKRKKVLFV